VLASAPACYSIISIEAGARHVCTPSGHIFGVGWALLDVANFGELRQREVRRINQWRTSGSVKVHSWVTAFGQQGTEPERGRSVDFGDS
jgi:hypothetical protein